MRVEWHPEKVVSTGSDGETDGRRGSRRTSRDSREREKRNTFLNGHCQGHESLSTAVAKYELYMYF